MTTKRLEETVEQSDIECPKPKKKSRKENEELSRINVYLD